MKALRKLEAGPGNMALEEVPEPDVTDGVVKIAVGACGLCGTDLHIRDGGYGFRPPVTMGHEICGSVVEVGAGVTRVRVGDRVTVNPTANGSCGGCPACRRGAYFFCPERQSLGSVVDGGFAEFVTAGEELVFGLPDDVPDEAGALVEPFACCVKAVKRMTTVEAGSCVLVMGPGPIGLMTAWLAKDAGARVVVSGAHGDAERLAAAEAMGLTTIDVTAEEPVTRVRDMTEGRGADVVFDCAGTRGAIAQGLDATATGGQFTQVALVDAPVEVDWGRIIYKELRVHGAIATDWPSWQTALEMVTAGRVDLAAFVTHRHRLDDWTLAFENADEKVGLKQILVPA